MQFFSADPTQLDNARPEIMSMKKYFDRAKYFPKVLVTQNKPKLQQAFALASADTWSSRLIGLEDALQTPKIPDRMRRSFLISSSADTTDAVKKLLDEAFLEKYEELLFRVLYDFDDFFPYGITRANHQVIIFEKLDPLSLTKHVLSRL